MKNKKQSVIAIATLIVGAFITSVLAGPAVRIQAIEAARSAFSAAFDSKLDPIASAPNPSSTTNLPSFHFLPPLAQGSGNNGPLDATLLNYLKLEICVENRGTCSIIQTFTVHNSVNEGIRLTGDHYHVNWSPAGADPNLNRTVRVVLAGLELGSITLSPNEYAMLGSTWPIKFRVEPDPMIRIRLLRSLGKNAWQTAAALKKEFNLCGQESAALMAADLEPYPADQIQQAIGGVCQDVIIPETTKIADDETIAAHTAYDPVTGRMVFAYRTDFLRDVRIDDVFVSESTPAAPFGFLRKITSTSMQSGGQVILETVQAKLTEAIYQGSVDATGELIPDDGTQSSRAFSQINASGFDKESAFVPNIVIDEGDTYNFHRDIDVTVNFNGGEDGVEGSGTVRVQGFAYFNAGYNVGIGIRSCLAIPPACPDRFEAWAGMEAKTRLRVTGNFDGRINKEQTIYQIPMKPILFFIGPIPVVLVPEMNLKLGINGEAHVDFAFEGEAKSTFKAGAKWLNPDYGGNGWNNISEFAPLERRLIEANANAKLRVEAYSKVDAKIMLYGVVGPGIDGSLGILIDADTSRKPLWFVEGHVTTNVNFEASIAEIIELGRYSTPILNEYFRIADSPNSPPIFSNVRTDTIFVDIGSPVVLGPRAGFQGYFDVVDPEGDVPILTAFSDRDGNIPLTYTFQTAGLRTITVTARDSEGATSTITLRIDVRNSLPIVNVTVQTHTIPATVQYFMTATAFDPETGFLTCNLIDFQVQAPDTRTLTGSGGTCGATVIFNQQGTRQVRVIATDPQGGVGESVVTVNVTSPPANLPPVVTGFWVSAYRGPLSHVCPDPNYLCEAPNGALINNGSPGSGDYYPPLYIFVYGFDPDGDPVSVERNCRTGGNTWPVVWDDTYGTFRCDVGYSPHSPITIDVWLSDGVNRVPAGSRTYSMLVRPN